jgi:hypothetical protein
MTTEQRKQFVTPILARAKRNAEPPPYGLDRREMDVLFLLTEGMYVPQISEEMLLPQSEVEEHVALIARKDARTLEDRGGRDCNSRRYLPPQVDNSSHGQEASLH